MQFNDKIYTFLKWLCLIALPALSCLYAAIDSALALGNVETVCTIIAAVETFIGALIGVSTAQYNKGGKNAK